MCTNLARCKHVRRAGMSQKRPAPSDGIVASAAGAVSAPRAFNVLREVRNVRRCLFSGGQGAQTASQQQDAADADPGDAVERTMMRDTLVAACTAAHRGVDQGHETVRRIRWALSQIAQSLDNRTFTDKQAQFHDMMLYATLPILFGAEWDMHEREILAFYGLDSHAPRVIMSMPRSGGKTIAVTSFLAAFLWATVDRKLLLVCFAIQQAQTSWIIDKTFRFISVLPGGLEMCQRSSTVLSTSLKAKRDASSTATVLRAQSGNAAGSRGIQPDVLILEEAAFIHDEMYYETVFPMLAKRGRAVFAISSPKEARGLFAMMFTLRFPDTGEFVFKSVKDENICGDCLRAGRMECSHIIPSLPPWKSKCAIGGQSVRGLTCTRVHSCAREDAPEDDLRRRPQALRTGSRGRHGRQRGHGVPRVLGRSDPGDASARKL